MTSRIAPTFIVRLALSDMRNHARLVLTPDPGCKIVTLSGENGAGKTNILESLSLLAPGRGLRRANGGEILRQANPPPPAWGMAAEIVVPAGASLIGTGSKPDEPEARRIVEIDGKPAAQQDLPGVLAVVWLVPEMDRLLVDSASERRRFLDRLVAGFDPAHAGRVNRYEQAMRERLKLLVEGRADSAWLTALEDTMTASAVAITAARREVIQSLNVAGEEKDGAFPCVSLVLSNSAADRLARAPALAVEDWLRDSLAAARQVDASAGMTTIGPHRADFLATHVQKNCSAALCSTGEQKALLIALVLAYARLVERMRGLGPILLLDDVTSHLDEARRLALYEALQSFSGQAWLSGTDDGIFAPLGVVAARYRIEPGLAERLS